MLTERSTQGNESNAPRKELEQLRQRMAELERDYGIPVEAARDRGDEGVRESEARLRILYDQAPVGICETDLAGRFLRVNDRFCEISGYSREELLVRSFADITHPEDVEKDLNEHARLLAGHSLEKRYLRPDGTVVWIELTGRLMRGESGQPLCGIGIVQDITGRKWAERRQTFFFTLNERLRDLSDPLAVMNAAARTLGEHLRVAQVGYGEIDAAQEHVLVHRDWNDGSIASALGIWRMEDFGLPLITEMKGGRTVAIPDITEDPRTDAPAVITAYRGVATRAVLNVPLVKAGRMVAMLFIHHSEPRVWNPAEVALVEETCERLWATVERAQAEKALRESEAHFRAALRAGSFGLWDWHQDTGLVTSDATHKRLFGFDPCRLTVHANEVFAVIHPDDRDEVYAAINRALEAQGFYKAEFRVVLPDGAFRWLCAYGDVVRGSMGEPLRIVGVNQDITERKRTEEALRTSQERLKLAQEAGQMGVFAWDLRTDRAWLSPNLLAMAGFSEDEWDGTLEKWKTHVHPDDHHCVMALLADAFASRALEASFEFRIVRPDNTVRWMYGRGRIHYDAEGTATRMMGINLDLTDRRSMEEALRQSNEELERFASMASHDLQEPLRMVTAYSQLLARRYHGQLDEQADQFLSFISDGAKRMGRLIQDLLIYARYTSGEPLQLRPSDANLALALALANLGERIDETKPTLTWDQLPEVLAVEGLLAQVFQNLVGNALKYRRPDITPEIHISAVREGSEWIVSVRDNGQGIAPEHQKHIFTLFTRLHGREVSGTGIGLATVKRIIERHGGRVWVDSEPGIGSTFYFTLPAVG